MKGLNAFYTCRFCDQKNQPVQGHTVTVITNLNLDSDNTNDILLDTTTTKKSQITICYLMAKYINIYKYVYAMHIYKFLSSQLIYISLILRPTCKYSGGVINDKAAWIPFSIWS